MIIDSFKNEYGFLSNFYPSPIKYNKKNYATVEHLYQASKTRIENQHEAIRSMPTPGTAKKLARMAILRPDWINYRLLVMSAALNLKFEIPELRKKLKETGDAELIEGNNWGDVYWGVCNNVGLNHLGNLLMEIRSTL